MNSNFNKSMLWLVMLSAVSQAYPMGGIAAKVSQRISPQLLRKAGVLTAGAGAAGATQFGISKLSAETPALETDVEQVKTIAARAAEKVAQGKTVVVEGYTSVKNFVVDKATDREFLAQGFCGMVTVGSVSYLAHKSGVFVKLNKHKGKALIGAGVVATALAGAAYMYPEVALNVAKTALNVTTNPYTALAAGAAVAAYGVGSKLTNTYAKAGSAAVVISAAAGIGAANKFGYADFAKNGVSTAANAVKAAAVWSADNVAKPVYSYTVAPVIAQAIKHPYIAGGIAATGAVATGAALYYKPWKKADKVKRQVIVHAPVKQQVDPQAQARVVQQAAPQNARDKNAVNISVEGDSQSRLAVRHDYKKDIPTKLIEAIEGNMAALKEARDFASNDNNVLKAIDDFMNCTLVKYLKLHYKNPIKNRLVTQTFNAKKRQSKNEIDNLAKVCGVKLIELDCK